MFDFFRIRNAQRVFLDYAATTPVSKKVQKEMEPFLSVHFANPSSIHKEGVIVRHAIEQARTKVARILAVKKEDVYFTAGGTESINLALLGVVRCYAKKNSNVKKPHIIVTAIEHTAVLRTIEQLEKEGVDVSVLPVTEEGLLDIEIFKQALRPETVLVSCMYANNEIGTILPISAIAKSIAHYKQQLGRAKESIPFFHTDASQASNYLLVQSEKIGVDMMTLDSSKMYGPKGVGILYKKKHIEIEPIFFGGNQEQGLRAGTENVSGIVGCAAALAQAQALRAKESDRLSTLQTYFISELLTHFPNARINGSLKHRLPNNVNVCFPGVVGEFLVLQLDARGIACSATTACKSNDESGRSYVIDALGLSDCAASSIRFSMGRDTKKRDIDFVIKALQHVV